MSAETCYWIKASKLCFDVCFKCKKKSGELINCLMSEKEIGGVMFAKTFGNYIKFLELPILEWKANKKHNKTQRNSLFSRND
jgi:hypothetical protein